NFDGLNTALMFDRSWGRMGVLYPGRMGPPGGICWTVIGAALVTAVVGPRRVVPFLALVAFGIATLSITGYFYGADKLYTLPYLTTIAFQRATFIVAVWAALFGLVPKQPPVRWLLDRGAVGTVARRAVPLLLFVPIAAGWLRVMGEYAGV